MPRRTETLTQADKMGPIISARLSLCEPADGVNVARSIGTESTGFDAVKHLISSKPLHRRGGKGAAGGLVALGRCPLANEKPMRASREPMGGSLDITEAMSQINRLDVRLKDERVIYVTRHSKQVFAVVDIEFLQTVLETIEIMSDPGSYKLFQESLEDIKQGKVHDHENMKRELGL